jgi:hypothetical protein
MHGVGLRSSSHSNNYSTSGEAEFTGKCAAAVQYAQKQKASFARRSPVYAELSSSFGSLQQQVVTDLADGSLPLYCHRRPLPCSQQHNPQLRSESKCMHLEQLQELMAESDRYYCERFSGTEGGLQATRLAFYPFFREASPSSTVFYC